MSVSISVEDGRVILHAGIDSHTLTPEDAWDLGDDLLIAADRLMTTWEPAEVDLPPWMTKIQVAVIMNDRLALVCEDHGAIHYPGMRLPVEDVVDLSRTHWTQQHSADAEVSEDTESEDEHGQGQPAQADAAGEVTGREDGQDRGDDVQDDGKHRPTPPPGGVMAW